MFYLGIWGGKDRVYMRLLNFSIYSFRFGPDVDSDDLNVQRCGNIDIPSLMNYTFDYGSINLMGFEILGGFQTLLFLAFLPVLL